jgi:transposase
MDVIHERVAGLDVHKETVAACVRVMTGGKPARECRTFATTTEGLLALLAWLTDSRCEVVAMEATGVYWMPIWKVLCDGAFRLIVANAAHIKGVPGRKTDMNDAMWIADLAACGLLRASFVPEESVQELRTLMRTRKQLGREQTRHAQRIQKTLTEANIKLDSVLSDIMGWSGRRMIEAMINGVRSPARLAELADRRVKASPKQLYDALHGRLTEHHRFLLKLHLAQWDALAATIVELDVEAEGRIAALDAEVEARRASEAEACRDEATFSELILLLIGIPGISVLAARTILAEIGLDMSRFATAGHLLAWAGMCPAQNESAGRQKRAALRKGAPWLKVVLVQCAWAARNNKNSYYRAQFFRLSAKRGPQKAICAVAASILTAIYHIIKNRAPHRDLGIDYFDKRSTSTKVQRLSKQLAKLGYDVKLEPIAAAA